MVPWQRRFWDSIALPSTGAELGTLTCDRVPQDDTTIEKTQKPHSGQRLI